MGPETKKLSAFQRVPLPSISGFWSSDGAAAVTGTTLSPGHLDITGGLYSDLFRFSDVPGSVRRKNIFGPLKVRARSTAQSSPLRIWTLVGGV